MLRRIEIGRFRSIEKLELDLHPLTVLIGPNGSGKSNLLDAFQLICEGARGSLADGMASRGGYDTVVFRGGRNGRMYFRLVWSDEQARPLRHAEVAYLANLHGIEHTYRVPSETVSASNRVAGGWREELLALRELGDCWFVSEGEHEAKEAKAIEESAELGIIQVRDQSRYPTVHWLTRELSAWSVYYPVGTAGDAPIRRSQVLRASTRMNASGGNLVSVLHSMKESHPETWNQMCDVLRTACPGFERLSFPSEGGDGMIVLRWLEGPFGTEFGFSANHLSDGTLRLLYLLAILLSPDPPPLVCIDEPELGLHPDWIKLVGELLQSAAERTQLIVATHSPELVSQMSPSQVVVVEKEDGHTVAKRLNDEDFDTWLDRFRLGELWTAGHFGGGGL